ncbi:MAG: ATP-binding cassette domain-containing protein [Christensenellaceae bacterium]|nr:ATP-binding cassette domain-containing protein [Christensenellaceae bacterium]
MLYINVQNVSKAFGDKNVLNDVSFSLSAGQKIGLVGVNGSGKSTLIKILSSNLQPDNGSITISKEISIAYLEQAWTPEPTETVMDALFSIFKPLTDMEIKLKQLEERMSQASAEELTSLGNEYSNTLHKYEIQGGYTFRSHINGVLNGLGFIDGDENRLASSLSGGELTRLNLARLLLLKPDVMLLDEPTNHLDIDALTWLESYLEEYNGAVIVVSHDRFFLDKICTDIIELLFGVSEYYSGNYTSYIKQRAERFETRMRAFSKQQDEIKRQTAIIERFRSFNREKSIKAAESREKKLEKMELLDRPSEEKAISFSFIAEKRIGDDALMVSSLKKSFGERVLFQDVSFMLSAGENAVIIGANGTGKTTLIECILGLQSPDNGNIKFGTNAQVGYYSQKIDELNKDKTVLREVYDAYPLESHTKIRNILAQFRFVGDDVNKQISQLSGGEKARVALTKLMLSGCNLLVMDEPTNHLDSDSREVLEIALENYNGTILAVSHDRFFTNRIADKILHLENGKINVYEGNYDDFLFEQEKQKLHGEDYEPGITKTQLAKNRKRSRDEERKIKELKLLVKNSEKDVAAAEEKLKRLEQLLSDTTLYNNKDKAIEIIKQHEEAKEEVEKKYSVWLKAEENHKKYIEEN